MVRSALRVEEGAGRPQALRVSLLRQMIDADPTLAGQAMQPVAVSYGGGEWLELDTDEDWTGEEWTDEDGNAEDAEEAATSPQPGKKTGKKGE